MSIGLLIAIILLIIILLGAFAGRWNAAYGNIGSVAVAIAALILFLMAVGLVRV